MSIYNRRLPVFNRIPRQYATRPNVFIMPDQSERKGEFRYHRDDGMPAVIPTLLLAGAVLLAAWVLKLIFITYQLPRPF